MERLVSIDIIRETEMDNNSGQKKFMFTRRGELFKRAMGVYLNKTF